jgi:hypothetical protein
MRAEITKIQHIVELSQATTMAREFMAKYELTDPEAEHLRAAIFHLDSAAGAILVDRAQRKGTERD